VVPKVIEEIVDNLDSMVFLVRQEFLDTKAIKEQVQREIEASRVGMEIKDLKAILESKVEREKLETALFLKT